MTDEEMQRDFECWKRSKRYAEMIEPKHANITDMPGIDLDLQLEQIIFDYRAISNLLPNKYTPFSTAVPLYLNLEKKTFLCTANAYFAKLWVDQINEKLQKSREAVIEELIKQSASKEELASLLNGIFSARCVDMSINSHIGDRDPEIANMHYIGVVISHYNSERVNIRDMVKQCNQKYEEFVNNL